MRFGRPKYIVKALILDVSQIRKVKDDDPEYVIEFSSAVLNMVTTIENLDMPAYLHNPQLLEELEGKLSVAMRRDWAKVKRQLVDEGTLRDFADWMKMEAELM